MTAYLLHGTTLALAWFLVVNAAASALIARLVMSITLRASSSPHLLFASRIFPAFAAALFVMGLFVPSYFAYEPREAVEGFDVTLTALAFAAIALWVVAARRGLIAWLGARRRTQKWMQQAQPIALPDGMRAFAIESDAPLMVLVGLLRPRLLVTRGLLDALTSEELAASVAHEVGHSRAWDNLKRLAMRAAPDFLAGTTAAQAMERVWAAAAERHADRHAASRSTAARCALASALVKVARLMPASMPHSAVDEPISAFVSGGDITSRVEGLLDDPPAAPRTHAAAFAIALLFLAIAAAYSPLLRGVHGATELLVRSLP